MKKIIISLVAILFLASCGQNSDTKTTETTKTEVTKKEVTIAENTPTYGNGKAKLEIFADFQCPACQDSNTNFAPVLKNLADEGHITIIYRQYPLSFHINAANDALAAMCANDQGKYQDYKDALYNLEISKKNQPVTDAERITLATETGLETESFSSCLKDKKYADYVKNDIKLGQEYRIPGTPTYVLDGNIFELSQFNVTTYAELEEKLKEYFTEYNK